MKIILETDGLALLDKNGEMQVKNKADNRVVLRTADVELAKACIILMQFGGDW